MNKDKIPSEYLTSGEIKSDFINEARKCAHSYTTPTYKTHRFENEFGYCYAVVRVKETICDRCGITISIESE